MELGEEMDEEEEIGKLTEYTISVPTTACRQDLVDLKTYLESVTPGDIQIYIDIQGQKKDTKIAVQDVDIVKQWTKKKGW